MKKLTAIGLLAAYLFNLVGYRMFFGWAQHEADASLSRSIALHHFDEKDLITVRVPLSMPYQTVNKGFEDVSGEVQVSGVVYHYVKRKVEMGELVLLCLPDFHASKLTHARDEFFNKTNGIATDDGTATDGSAKKTAGNAVAPDFSYDFYVCEFGIRPPGTEPALFASFISRPCCDREGLLPEQPPEA